MTNEEFLALLKTEEARRAVIEMIIEDLKSNGPIRWALAGVYPEAEKKSDA